MASPSLDRRQRTLRMNPGNTSHSAVRRALSVERNVARWRQSGVLVLGEAEGHSEAAIRIHNGEPHCQS